VSAAPRPWNLVAELTYRCPLRCAYCSNPVGWSGVPDRLDAAAWSRVIGEAADLGAVHAGLTGGEPTLRDDLEEIVAATSHAGLHPHLVTAGTTLPRGRLEALCERGLRSVQVSVQDVSAEDSDAVAGRAFFDRKLACARDVRALGLHLTLNVVLQRRNIGRVREIVALARELGADRLELANVQLHGWALRNRAALLPARAEIEAAAQDARDERRAGARLEIVFVLPDHFSGRPKPCMGGWGARTIVVDPSGRVLPCHGAAALPELEFWSVPEHTLRACWSDAPGMNAFRGDAWMREPCRSCPERTRDFGGCRCQAFALTGDAAATDPACDRSPLHSAVVDAVREAEDAPPPALVLRSAQAPA